MKKNNLLLCALFCATIPLQSQVKLEPFKPMTDIPELSFYQGLQLDYLSHELNQHSKIIASDWTDNEKTQLLIEQLELDVKESSKETQDFMKERIIQLFNDYEINIFFTSDNSIQRVTQKETYPKETHQIHRDHENDDEPDSSTTPHYHFHSLHGHKDQDGSAQDHIEEKTHLKESTLLIPHKKTDATPIIMTPAQLHRIHGGRRTLNKIKRRLAENERREKELRNKINQESTLTNKTKQEQTLLTKQKKQEQVIIEQIEQDKAQIEQIEQELASIIQSGRKLTQPETNTSIKPRTGPLKEPRQERVQQEERLKQDNAESKPKSDTHEAPEHIIF
ncbi:MAG: hypothetical protein WC747_04735 [Candidatus Babeliales bacterium]|jgi:hypothetical protein